MTLVKLKSNVPQRAGSTIGIAFAGVVTFDEQACIEVDESIAESLIEVMPEFALAAEFAEDTVADTTPTPTSVVDQISITAPVVDVIDNDEEDEFDKTEKDELNPETDDIDHQIEDTLDTPNVPAVEAVGNVDESTTVVENAQEESTQEETETTDAAAELPLRETLENHTLAELKTLVANYPKDLTRELRKKEDYVNFLANDLEAHQNATQVDNA